MKSHADKTIAYIDRAAQDEILEVERTDTLPRRGQPVTVDNDQYEVYEVKPVRDAVFDALVTLERKR